MHETVFNYVTNNSIILRRINKTMRVKRMRSTDLNYWIKHPFEFSDPILKPEYL